MSIFLERNTKKALRGGIWKLWFLNLSEESPIWPIVSGARYDSPITLATAEWQELKFTPNSFRPLANNTTIDGGDFWDFNAPANVVGVKHSQKTKLQHLAHIPLVLKFQDKNGNIHIVGSPESPVKMVFTTDNPQGRSNERPEMNVEFRCLDKYGIVRYDF